MIESNIINKTSCEIEEELTRLFKLYKETDTPIEVSFRELISDLRNPDRATHLIHTYPAKLLTHIPYFFLNNEILSKKGDLVLDPFSGSGTVLLEAIIAKRNAIGSDTNPLARLITKVKTTKLEVSELKLLTEMIVENSKKDTNNSIPGVINIDHWFLPHVKLQLNNIFHCVNSIQHKEFRDFFLICFSNCVKKVSLADPRVSVPVRLRYDQYGDNHPLHLKTKNRLDELQNIDVLSKFKTICVENIRRLDNLLDLTKINNSSAKIVSNDARDLKDCRYPVEDESVDLVITSPPYAGAQKYIRSSSLSLGWLDMIEGRTLAEIEENTIGRENYKSYECHILKKTGIQEADILLEKVFEMNKVRACIASNYLLEMSMVFKELNRVVKKGGYVVLVSANNEVCGMEFRTQEYLHKMMTDYGFKTKLKLLDHIKSRGLMTKRNKTASLITREWVTVYEK